MKLQLISDTHSEFYRDPIVFTDSIEIVPNLDILVLAGDIVVPNKQPIAQVRGVFDSFARRARRVVFVVGNHCYYGGSPRNTEFIIKSVLPANYTWLDNQATVIDGVCFYGGAMWFDNHDQLNFYFKQRMNDFYQISGLEPWVYERNKEFVEQGRDLIDKDTVVVTHHLPHPNSTPEMYRGDELSRFFMCDMTGLMAVGHPRLWLHGHTHSPCDYVVGDPQLGETRIVCNPFGYPRERQGPYPPVVLEV